MNFILRDGGYFHILLYMFEFCSVTQINYLVSFPSFFFFLWGTRAFPGGSVVKNLPTIDEMQETQVQSLGWEDPLEKEMEPTPVFLPGKSHGQRSLAGYSSWDQRRAGHDWANTHTCTHSVLQLKANFSVLLKQYNSKYFTQSPVYYKDFPPRLWRTKIITSVLWYPGTVLAVHYKLFLRIWWFHHILLVSRIKQMT